MPAVPAVRRARQARKAAGLIAGALLLAGCTPDAVEAERPARESASPEAAAIDDDRAIDACDVLTSERASRILGPVADIPTSTAAATTDGDAAVTSCTYLAADRNERGGRVTVGLVVRTALSDAGAVDNRRRFEPAQLPDGAEQVDGLGDRAFWAPGLGQLNVLADDQWFVVTYGGIDPRENTLSATRRAAGVIAGPLESAARSASTPTEGESP